MDQLKPSASEGLISKDTIMGAESADIIPLSSAKPMEWIAAVSSEAAMAEVAEAAEAAKKEPEAAMVDVNIDSDKEEGEGEADDEEQEGGGGGGGGGGAKQKQRRPKKGFVQSLLGVLKKSSPKATPPDSPQQSVSSKSFLRGLRPLISRIRKNDAASAAAPAGTAASATGSSMSFSDKDVQTAIQEARANLQNAHEVAEKIFSENMGD